MAKTTTFTDQDNNALWSDAANWDLGLPVNGDAAAMQASSIDDLSSLSLTGLSLGNGPYSLEVASGNTLTVTGNVLGEGSMTVDAGAAVTIAGIGTLDTVSFTANGAGASFIDQSTTDGGGQNYYYAENGGFVELNATPSSSAFFSYNGSAGTFALAGAATGTNAESLYDVAAGDALELPGSADLTGDSVSFTGNTLIVTTSAGTYDFTQVGYNFPYSSGQPSSYSISYDSSTGLDKITLNGPDQFSSQNGSALWSNAANWNTGLPVNGDAVAILSAGTDDLSSLSLTGLYLANSLDSLEVASGKTLTVTGQVLGLESSLTVDAGAAVTVAGVSAEFSYFTANGVGASFIDQSTTDGGGQNYYYAENGGFVELNATPSSSALFSYNGSAGTFALAGAVTGTNAESLLNVGAGAALELPGSSVSSVTFGTKSLMVTTNLGTYDFTNVGYAGAPTGYSAEFDAATGLAEITLACYCRGTRILTAHGEVAIETLKIGDLVETLSGGLMPIRWIGQRRYAGWVAMANPDVLPVFILAGALEDGVPRRDLWVSPEHAMFIDDVLIRARDLTNGHTIVQEESVDEVTYFHLEFDTHTVIYAEGAPAESFVDDESRQMFDNAEEYYRLYPDAIEKPARFCAQRVEDGWELEAVRCRLAERARHAATRKCQNHRSADQFIHA